MNIPVQCERTKNVYVTQAFIRALEETCNWRKAERLPIDSFYELYVGTNVLNDMESSDHQIIWGRRGTGKTHLLKAFVQKVNDNPNCKKLAYYISCDNINAESPVDMQFESDEQKMKYFAKETFRNFLADLIEQLMDTYRHIISNKYFYNENLDEAQQDEYHKSVENFLLKLAESCEYGSPSITQKERVEVTFNKEEDNSENTSGKGIEGKVAFPLSIMASANATSNHMHSGTVNAYETGETKVVKKYVFSLSKTREQLKRLLNALGIDMLYICIDELWLVDQKRELSIQPIFLDYVRQVFLNSNKISVKIASIREVTKLNSKASPENSFGMQSGHDITELINLDTQFVKDEDRLKHYKDILYYRINYFNHRDNTETDTFDIEYIVNTIFKNDSNFSALITLTHVIPRNFFTVLKRSLMLINYDLQHYFVHQYLIRNVVIKTYLEDKRSNLPMNNDSLFYVINKYINTTRHFFFLLSSEQAKRLRNEVDNLIYVEIIHQVPSSILPNAVMDSYKGFYVDSGKYLFTLREAKVADNQSYTFSYMLPESLGENYQDYIIDLDDIESDYIECPNCGSRINKNHPVYKKANICPTCACELK